MPGDQPAVVAFGRDSARTTSRDELFERAGRLAAGLGKAGLERGDRVVLMAPNSADWIVSALGVMHAGAVVVPLDVQMPDEDLAHALGDCDPAFLFTTAALRERIDALDLDLNAQVRLFGDDGEGDKAWSALLASESAEAVEASDDLAAIFYTSGTTGPPKGVPLTHRNLASNVEALDEQGLADHRDRALVPLPFHHVYPFTVGILIPLTLGATITIPFSLVGPQIVRALREGEATVMLGVPGLYEAMYRVLEERIAGRGRLAAVLFRGLLGLSMAARRRLGWRLGRRLFAPVRKRIAPDLRLMVAGGAALDPDLGRRLQGLGWEVASGYGLSETSPILTFNAPEQIRLESAGIALPGVELRIDVREGEGEILARGPNVFDGYWNLPDKTAEDLDDEGWFHTGDIGQLDEDGYLYLHGRKSTMIVLPGGENVDPQRVEKALTAAEGIREAGVLEHEDRLAAVVVPEAGLLREAGDENFRQRVEQAVEKAARALPSHHRPGTVRIAVDPLPRTRLDKLRRHKLEELFGRLAESGGVPDAPPEPISPESMSPEDQQLLSDPAAEGTWNYLAQRYGDLRLTPDSSLNRDLEIDSIGWVDLSLALREQVGIELDETAIARVSTVRDLLQEAAASAETDEAAEDLSEALQTPEQLLDSEQKEALAPLGRVRQIAGRVLLGVTRFVTRLLLRVEIRGRIPENGIYLIAPRHLSALDPLVLIPALSSRQLESLYWAGWAGLMHSGPLTRWFSRTAHVLPIDPGAAPRSSLALAATALKRGHTLVWFPEGQRSPDGALQRFRPGIGPVLRAQPVPVIPVWIDGTREAMPPGRILPRPGRVRVIVGDPIPPERYGRDEREIVNIVHSELAALGDEGRAGED